MNVRTRLLAGVALLSLAAGCANNSGGGGDKDVGGSEAADTRGFSRVSNLAARVDRMPTTGKARPLIVTADVEVTSANYQPRLTLESVNKSNPPQANLRLRVDPTGGQSSQVLTTKPVRFEDPDLTDVRRVNVTDPTGKIHAVNVEFTD